MSANSFGKLFKLSSFGESHGAAIGGIIEGCPAGLNINVDFIQNELKRRRPGQSTVSSPRAETDEVEFLSGIFEGRSTGTPIGFIIRNADVKSADYDEIQQKYRPSHADYTYDQKYGFRDYRGGGRSSARETACRVVAGAIAKLLLADFDIKITAFVQQVGKIKIEKSFDELDLTAIENNIVRCPDAETATQMIEAIESAREQGDTLGGIIHCSAINVPAGWGEPVFDKLNALLAHAMLSINAVKGFELGSGFEGTTHFGSEQNDEFIRDADAQKTTTSSNNSGGIQGGISNGMPIYFNVAFKPVATIKQKQKTVDQAGKPVFLEAKGRHDPCVLPRAVPIVESMTALVLADLMLLSRTNKI